MKKREEWSAALGIVAAIAGAGFASGREIVTFFSGAGWASWIGVVLAAAFLGLFAAMLATLARRGKAVTLPGIYSAIMNRECGDAVALLHGLAMLLTTSVMLTAGGELGALALNLRWAYLLGLLATLGLGLLLSSRGFRLLRVFGAFLAPCLFLFCVALALDPSPAPRAFIAVASHDISGNVVAACLLGALYAALNAAMSGSVLSELAQGPVEPRGLGLRTGLLLLALLVPANAALLRAGPAVRELALPNVVLAARWGTVGFCLSIASMWLCVATTLGAALGSLRGLAAERGLNPRLALLLAVIAGILLGVIGFPALVRVGYPLLGWVCALALIALVPFLKEDPDER